jgi:hypothetical protein
MRATFGYSPRRGEGKRRTRRNAGGRASGGARRPPSTREEPRGGRAPRRAARRTPRDPRDCSLDRRARGSVFWRKRDSAKDGRFSVFDTDREPNSRFRRTSAPYTWTIAKKFPVVSNRALIHPRTLFRRTDEQTNASQDSSSFLRSTERKNETVRTLFLYPRRATLRASAHARDERLLLRLDAQQRLVLHLQALEFPPPLARGRGLHRRVAPPALRLRRRLVALAHRAQLLALRQRRLSRRASRGSEAKAFGCGDRVSGGNRVGTRDARRGVGTIRPGGFAERTWRTFDALEGSVGCR